ncbi:hypothetical protein CRM22_007988 [Opisthorchis felineus]|uniref:Uncharacterized protein n=1 Tax=Opisthorchis felineus TaxID=147828 RepID=A0A4S2LD89_OPIFE|nr:hypothetical protein CRM22_007988 [Opisthorchis felineus]
MRIAVRYYAPALYAAFPVLSLAAVSMNWIRDRKHCSQRSAYFEKTGVDLDPESPITVEKARKFGMAAFRKVLPFNG